MNAEHLKEKYRLQLTKAAFHLEHSFQKAKTLSPKIDGLTSDELEVWEGLTARFSRVVDLFVSKYLRAVVLEQDPGFDGTLRDYLHVGEKLNVIHDSKLWLAYRGVRNRIVHEYTEKDLENLFAYVYQATPIILQEIKKNAS